MTVLIYQMCVTLKGFVATLSLYLRRTKGHIVEYSWLVFRFAFSE